MEMDSVLYQSFLEELQGLERFRISYSGLHPEVGLERDDPDVRRLIEAMAVLSARARLAGQRTASKVSGRLFAQQLPYLLSPVPSLGIVQAQPQPGFVQAEALEEGEHMLVQGPSRLVEGALQPAPEALFRLLRPLDVLPIKLESVRSVRREEGGRLLHLEFTSPQRRGWQVERFGLLIDHLSELQSSATVFRALHNHLTRATVAFDRDVRDGVGDLDCKVSFGRPAGLTTGNELVSHPLQQARMFFRLPQQYMFMNVEMPPHEENWKKFTICLELDAAWPRGLAVSRESFKLNTVPVVNLSRELTDPIDCDGTRDRYRLLHPDPVGEMQPHSVVGAYLLDLAEGMVPLLSGAMPLPDGLESASTYEIEYEGRSQGRRAWAILDTPGAFEEPVQVAVDTYWYQPNLTSDRELPEIVRPAERNQEGVAWRALAAFTTPVASTIEGDDEALLDLLAIKNQPVLDRTRLKTLLEVLCGGDTVFAQILRVMDKVTVSSAPYAHAAAGVKQIYEIDIGALDAGLVAVLDLMGPRLKDVLQAWSSQEVVELVIRVPSLELELTYRELGVAL